MATEKSGFEEWWEAHPVFTKVYVPLLLTITFLVTLLDALNSGKG